MITTSTFSAGPPQRVSLRIYRSRFLRHLGRHGNKHFIHAVSASVDCGITTREIKWFSGPMPESACLSVRPSSPLLSLKRSQTQMNPPERRERDCKRTGGAETALGAGCWLIINEGRYPGCSQSWMCSSDTTAQVPGGTLYNPNQFSALRWGFTLPSVCVTIALSLENWSLQNGLTQLRWVTPRKWPQQTTSGVSTRSCLFLPHSYMEQVVIFVFVTFSPFVSSKCVKKCLRINSSWAATVHKCCSWWLINVMERLAFKETGQMGWRV